MTKHTDNDDDAPDVEPMELLAMAMDPARWPADFASDEMETLFVVSGTMSVITLADPADLDPLHRAYFEKAPPERRMSALTEILDHAEAIDSSPIGMAMLPFLRLETDRMVLSTAGLCFCTCAFPSESGDVTVGAGMLIEIVIERVQNGESVEAGILASGVMLMGDGRFLDAMERAWESLDGPGREAMTQADTEMATHAHVRFLLRRLRKCTDAAEYGCLAAALARLSRAADQRGVVNIERQVPVSGDLETPVRCLGSWTKEEYARFIRPELEELAMQEIGSDEQVMPMVLSMWGSS